VIAAVRAREDAGLETSATYRAILGSQAKKLISLGGWDYPTLIEAARRVGPTNRHPRFYAEWVATVFNADDLQAHAKRKAEEAEERKTTRGLSPLGDILRRAAAAPTGEKTWAVPSQVKKS